MTETIAQRTCRVIADVIAVPAPAVHHLLDLQDDLGLDSLDYAELALALEEEYQTDLPEHVLSPMPASVHQLVLRLEKFLA
jgi:acyl carrier protein